MNNTKYAIKTKDNQFVQLLWGASEEYLVYTASSITAENFSDTTFSKERVNELYKTLSQKETYFEGDFYNYCTDSEVDHIVEIEYNFNYKEINHENK